MATLKQYTFTIIDADGNPVSFTEAQTKTMVKLAPSLVQGQQLGTQELLDSIVTRIVSGIKGDSIYGITIAKLIEAHESVAQAEINPSKVAAVLTGDHALLKGHPLYKPVLVGRKDDGSLVNMGGRHRVAAIVSLLKFFGADDDYILNVQIPAVLLDYTPALVMADNQSRGVTAPEKTMILLSMNGVPVGSATEVWTSFNEGLIPGSYTSQRGAAMRVAFIFKTEDLELVNKETGEPIHLTRDTRGKVASGLVKMFADKFPSHKHLVKDSDFLVELMKFAAEHLNDAVNATIESGETMLARCSTSYVNYIGKKLKGAVAEGTFKLPQPVKVEPKPVIKVEEKPKAEKKTRTKKVKADTPVQEEAVTA